jgi:glycosyltransferase involved in cell wall biosynthesis
MKIAWFTPFCTRSAIGRYSAVILDELTKEHEVVVFATGLRGRAVSHRPDLPTVRIEDRGGTLELCESLARFDVVVYNLGDNAPFHGDIHRTLVEYPGVAIVHDVSTWGLFGEALLGARRDVPSWLTQLEYSHGAAGRAWGTRLLAGWARPIGSQDGALRYNMTRSCVRRALGVVVHGEWARGVIAGLVPAPVAHIDFPAFLVPEGPAAAAGPEGGKVRLLTIGAVNANKAPDLVVEALGGSPFLRDRAEYTIAGSLSDAPPYIAELRSLVRRHGLGDAVRFIDRPDDALLHRLVSEADVLINLRYPHLGECSGSLQEALFHGKPTVVWGHGYYDEFPESVVCKVLSLPQLVAVLERLVASPEERRLRGARSLEYASERFCTRRYCRSLLSFLEGCCRARPACRLVDRLAERLSEFYAEQAPAELVARLVNEVNLMSRPRPNLLPAAKAA